MSCSWVIYFPAIILPPMPYGKPVSTSNLNMASALRNISWGRGFATHSPVQGFNGAVGNTPLASSISLLSYQPFWETIFDSQIYLKGLSRKTGSHIYGKAEFQNPGGSVKDRAALGLVRDAEGRGLYGWFSLSASKCVSLIRNSSALNQGVPLLKELRVIQALALPMSVGQRAINVWYICQTRRCEGLLLSPATSTKFCPESRKDWSAPDAWSRCTPCPCCGIRKPQKL